MSAILLLASCQATQAQLPGPNDTFARAGLSAKEVREIVAAVEASAYDNADSWTSELHVKRVTLGRAPGLIVRGTKLLCGATGNCQTWVFRQVNGNWFSLFKSEEAPIIESLQLGPNVTNGIKDLTVATNSSAESNQRVTYGFDGAEYRSK